jgi:energy-coupling factor transporter ATP-binding protein EcfA2
MRKLTVKNFSVIKEAELEFGKITVLIGPQSSGKSLLCKLAYFLGKELVELSARSISNGSSWDEYLRDASKAFWSRFSSGDKLIQLGSEMKFSSYQYEVALTWGADPNLLVFRFSEFFVKQYESLLADPIQGVPAASGALIPGGISSIARKEEVWIALNRLLSQSILEAVVYIPAGRAFFTSTSKGFALLQNVGIDSITREFAAQIQWDSRWAEGMFASRRGVTDEMKRSMTDILHGFVKIDSGVPRFIDSEGRKLPLEVVSTGVQEMIPLFNILEQLMYTREHLVEAERATYIPAHPKKPVSSKPLIYLEEPEANIFPKTQYDLVRLFTRLANDPILNFGWVITTHSPYILSSFNNLLEAWQVAAAKPDAKAEVAKLIEERYWIRPSDFKAYCIHDGKLESIMDEETGLINGNYLDGVSNEIGSQFDELLRIGYVEA